MRQGAKIELVGFAERFTQVLQRIGGISEFVRRSGRSRATIDRWANAQTPPSLLDLIEIARIGEVSLEWLIEGAGEPEIVSNSSKEAEVVQIPILDAAAAAGCAVENYQDEHVVGYLPFACSELRAMGVDPKNARALRLRGDSMVPTAMDGRLALMDVSRRELVDGKVYVLRAPDGLRAKRIHRRMDGRVVLVSDNREHYEPEVLSQAEAERMTVIGRLFWADRLI